MRVALLSLVVLVGCAGRTPPVTRLVDGRPEVGEYVSPEDWEDAFRREREAARRVPGLTELERALAAGDHEAARASAARLEASSDPRVREHVGEAFVGARDAVSLERFVRLHSDETAFALAWGARIGALGEPLDDALARALATHPRFAARGALALARAGLRDESVAALGRIVTPSLDEQLLVAEAELELGLANDARRHARAAYEGGASFDALALEARALEALGHEDEARTLRRRISLARPAP